MSDSPHAHRPARIGRSALVQLLAPTLGMEKSREVVSSAAKELGLPDPASMTLDQAEALMNRLGTAEGIVGVVARFAVGRLVTLLETENDETTDTGIVVRPPKAEPSTGSYTRLPTVSMNDLVELFATTLGAPRASEVLRAAAAHLALGPGPWPRPQAMTLLDHLSAAEGIVGVVARFSQPRVLQKLSR
jgi:hypothetical protein